MPLVTILVLRNILEYLYQSYIARFCRRHYIDLPSTTLTQLALRKDYRIGTLRYNWPMSAHASQAFSTSTVLIQKIYPYRL